MIGISNRFLASPVAIFVVLAALAGCNAVTGGGSPDNDGVLNPDSDETPSSDIDTQDPPDDEPPLPQASDDALPDFSIPDVNAASARLGEEVSPRDYLGQVSAWYFGQST